MTAKQKPVVTVRVDHLEAAIEALKYKAHSEAAQSQAPDLFDADDTADWQHADELRQAIDSLRQSAPSLPPPTSLIAGFKERRDVLAFQQKFKVPMASSPQFLQEEAFQFRLKFMYEELKEFHDGHVVGDMHEAADALVDLAYVLHGTALMMGLPWPMLWDEVQRANMLKVRARHADESKRGSALDIVKPAGWVGPDHTAALGAGPWGIFDHKKEGS